MLMTPKSTSLSNLVKQIIEACIPEIQAWMTINYLKLNEDKNKLLFSRAGASLTTFIQVGNNSVEPLVYVQNLGGFLDSHVKLQHHITQFTLSLFTIIFACICYFQARLQKWYPVWIARAFALLLENKLHGW